jgi:hypothetical protein
MSGYLAGLLAMLSINVIVAYSVFLPGSAGLLNLGAAGFVLVGAYTAGALSSLYDMPLAPAIALGSAMSALVAFLIAFPILRTRGIYMVLATFAAVAFGYVQHRNERAGRVERYEAEVAKRAEQAVKAVKAVRRTLKDRQNHKLTDHYTEALHERPAELVCWRAAEAAPRKTRAEAVAAARRAAAEASRKQATELERQVRDRDNPESALKALLEAA